MTVMVEDAVTARGARTRYYVESVGELSWSGILAGTVVALAVGAALMLAGTGIGLTMVDLSPGSRPSATTLGWTTLIWLILVQAVSMAAGGYVAGRALTPDLISDLDKRQERYGMQGLAVWGAASVVGMLMATVLVTGGVSIAVRAATGLGGAAATAISGGAGGAPGSPAAMSEGELGFQLRQLLPVPRAGAAPSASAATTPTPASAGTETASAGNDTLRSDAAAILQRAWSRRELAPSDRAYLAGRLSQNYGLTQQEAEQRVNETEARIREAANAAQLQAREAAEAAAKTGKVLAFVGFAIAVIGAIAAVGGGLTAESHRRILA